MPSLFPSPPPEASTPHGIGLKFSSYQAYKERGRILAPEPNLLAEAMRAMRRRHADVREAATKDLFDMTHGAVFERARGTIKDRDAKRR